MDDTTRRRVIQGAGVIGITGVVGGVVAGQESPTPTEGETALRVTHASPDAPAVNVTLDDQTVVENLEFGNVADYQTVEPGTYQLQIVPAEDGGGFLGGVLGDLFGSNEQGETVLYDQEVTVEAGATYTAVAYGEAGQGAAETPTAGTPTPNETATPDGGATPTETETPDGGATPTVETLQAGGGQAGPLVQDLGFGESASATVPAGDYRLMVRPADDGDMTPTPGEETTPTPDGATTPAEAGTPESGTEFQVTILEDDLSSPPEGESRARVFHAVPDVGPVNVIATPQDGQGQGQGQGQGGQGQGQGGGPGQGQGQGQGQGGGPGQGQGQGQGQGGGPGQGQGQGQGPPLSANVTLEAGTVYSSFAVGYVDPDAAAEETPTDGGTPADEATPTDGSPVGTPAEGDLPGFELLVVETATDGERVEGGGT
ncbi:DUF4397 domain-containing protein [Haloarcula rara]|nr:DUF4397 domain-containing protein [Halomicroarcula sp. SHR3]